MNVQQNDYWSSRNLSQGIPRFERYKAIALAPGVPRCQSGHRAPLVGSAALVDHVRVVPDAPPCKVLRTRVLRYSRSPGIGSSP